MLPVADLYRIGATGDFKNGSPAEGFGELLGVDGGGGNDYLEIPPFWQEIPQDSQNQIDIEAPLVGLIDNQGIVAVEKAVALESPPEEFRRS